MGNLKKGLIIMMTLVVTLLVSVTNVSATEFSSIMGDVMSDVGYTINAGEEITFNGEVWIGTDGRISINSGSATLKLDGTTGVISIDVLDGSEVVINDGKQFIMQLTFNPGTGEATYPVALNIHEGATLTIDGNMAIPSGSQGILTNNGTININGILEVRRDGIYDGLGTTNLYGTLAIYGDSSTTNIGDAKINIYEGANIYSEDDINSNIVVAESDTEEFTWAIVENSKSYTSITDSITDTEFAYGYTLAKNAVEIEDPATDVDEPTDVEEPTIENPSTIDNVMLFVGLGIVAVIGIVVTSVVLKKSK